MLSEIQNHASPTLHRQFGDNVRYT